MTRRQTDDDGHPAEIIRKIPSTLLWGLLVAIFTDAITGWYALKALKEATQNNTIAVQEVTKNLAGMKTDIEVLEVQVIDLQRRVTIVESIK